MSKKVPSPLVDVAIGYVNDVNPDLNQDILKHIRSLFDGYINETVSYDEIAYELNIHLENLTPLEKICSILSLAYVPAPKSPTAQQTTKAEDSNNANRNNHHTHSYNNFHNWNANSKDYSSSTSTTTTGKSRKKTRSWTNEEDQRLLMGVHLYGLENWTLVAQFVGNNRTRSMCSQRWIRVLDPKISKSHWTEDDDQQLLQMVQLYGEKSWMKIASKLGNRSDVQCRYHYQQLQRESKITVVTSSPIPSPPTQPQSSIFSNVNQNYNFQNTLFTPTPLNSISTSYSSSITPAPSNLKTTSLDTSIVTNIKEFPSQNNKQEMFQIEKSETSKQHELPPLTEHEFHLRLDEPFGIDDSFDLFKSDPMFNLF